MATEPYYAVGNTHRFRDTLKKDGVAWPLGSAVVTVVFQPPDGADEFTRTATVESAAGGIAYYDTLTTDLYVKGDWSLYFRVVDGSLDLVTTPYEFTVYDR